MIAAAAHKLGRILRKLLVVGKPKHYQGHLDLAALVQIAVSVAQQQLALFPRLNNLSSNGKHVAAT